MITQLGIMFQVQVMLDFRQQLRLGFLDSHSFSLMLSLLCTHVTQELASSAALYLFIWDSQEVANTLEPTWSPGEAGVAPRIWTLRIF